MKKSFLAIVIILSMLVTMGMSGNAAESRTVTVKPILTFDNTTATCQVCISAAGKQISATALFICKSQINSRQKKWRKIT